MKKPLKTGKRLIITPERILLILLFLIPFCVYVYTLCPTLSVYADAGEFPTFAYLTGFAHPPGYPLFTLILKLFLLLPFDSVAYKANLAAAFISAATIPLFYLLVKKLVNNSVAAAVASLTLAFSQIYWMNAVVSEVFGLLALFIILSIYLFALWLGNHNKKVFFAYLFVAGLGLAHHQLMVITLLPLLVYFLVTKKWKLITPKVVLQGVGFVLLGFLPYLYVLFFAAPKWPLMNWNNPSTLTGLFHLITRASYGTFTLTNEAQNSELFVQALDILKMYLNTLSAAGIVLFVVGLVYSAFKNLKIFFYSLFVIAVIFVFSLFSGMPLADPVQVQYLERFQIISAIFICLSIGFGLVFLQKIKQWKSIFCVVLFLLPLYLLKTNFNKVNQRNNYFADKFTEDMLSTVPQNSIFLVEGDAVINNLFYYKYVLGKRTDVSYTMASFLTYRQDWYIEEIKRFYPDIILPNKDLAPKDYIEEFIIQNSRKRPIMLYVAGFEKNLDIWIPKINRGIVSQFADSSKCSNVLTTEEDILSYLNNYQALKENHVYAKGSAEYALMNVYAQPYIYLAEINDNNIAKLEKYYGEALRVDPSNYVSLIELGDDYDVNDQPAKAVEAWKKALPLIWNKDVKALVQSKIDQHK